MKQFRSQNIVDPKNIELFINAEVTHIKTRNFSFIYRKNNKILFIATSKQNQNVFRWNAYEYHTFNKKDKEIIKVVLF